MWKSKQRFGDLPSRLHTTAEAFIVVLPHPLADDWVDSPAVGASLACITQMDGLAMCVQSLGLQLHLAVRHC